MFGFLTRQPEQNLPLTVLLSQGRRQVAGVHAAVRARHVEQDDAVGPIQLDQRLPQIRVVVPVGGAVGEVSGQQAPQTRLPEL